MMKYREIKERLEIIESYIEAAKGYVMGEEEEGRRSKEYAQKP